MRTYVRLGIRNRPMLESLGLLDSYRHPVAGSDCMIEKCLECGDGFAVTNAYEIEDRKRLRVLMEEEIQKGKYTQHFFDAIDKTYKDAVREIKRYWKEDHTKASVEQLILRYDTFFNIYTTTLHPMVLAIYASDLQDVFESELKAAVGNEVNQEEFIGYCSVLLTPTRLTQVQMEEEKLFSILREYLSEASSVNRASYDAFVARPEMRARFGELEEKYGFFHMEYINEPRKAGEYIEQLWRRIEDEGEERLRQQPSPRERLQQIIVQQREFLDSHNASKFFRDLVFAMQEFLIVLDYSKADLVEGIYYARPLLTELGKRVGLGDWISVRYLLPDELKQLLRSGKTTDRSYIAGRRHHFAMLLENMTITPYFDDAALEIVDKLLVKDEITDDMRDFRGLTAFPGKVRGIACIVTGADNRHKFKQGQILVTRDTTTELTGVIKMASAIVADQGSLLSHTAIVSREFRIPCLVETKIGTRLVKDGDELEVDASAGTVRILSR